MVEGVVRAFRRVVVVAGLAGGLLRELVVAVRVVDGVVAVVAVRLLVDSLGATDLVGGLVGGCADRDFKVAVSSVEAVRVEGLSMAKQSCGAQQGAAMVRNRQIGVLG